MIFKTITDTLKSTVDSEQSDWIQTNDRYKQVLETQGAGFVYSITEYLGPTGIGYEVVSISEELGKTYKMVEGNGSESAFRNHAWAEIRKPIN